MWPLNGNSYSKCDNFSGLFRYAGLKNAKPTILGLDIAEGEKVLSNNGQRLTNRISEAGCISPCCWKKILAKFSISMVASC